MPGNCRENNHPEDTPPNPLNTTFNYNSRNFSDKYNENQIVISCRIAAYNYLFEKFSDVEIADFNKDQIKTFVSNWFGSNKKMMDRCWKSLNGNPQIMELGSTPLLLTLLCLSFEQSLDFPTNRSELFKEAIDALLKKWDASRCIKREEIYKKLSLKRKESMLSRIAAITFQNGDYFIPQRVLEKHISNFIINLHRLEIETVEPDSETVLKAIEAHHGIFVERAKGIYSFSHLTFQEYFTAKYIVDNTSKKPLQKLLSEKYLADVRWREVILLVAEMLDEADQFLLSIKYSIEKYSIENKLDVFLFGLNKLIPLHNKHLLPVYRAFAMDHFLAEIICPLEEHISLDITIKISKVIPFSTELFSYIQNSFDKYTLLSDLKKAHPIKRSDLQVYLRLNLLLLDCLISECYISKNNRKKIVDELFTISQ